MKRKLKEKDAELVRAREQNLVRENKSQNDRMDKMTKAIVCLQRMSLVDAHSKYMAEGAMNVDAKRSMEDLYASYHDLGGNGIGTKLHDDMIHLPEQKYSDRKSTRLNSSH